MCRASQTKASVSLAHRPTDNPSRESVQHACQIQPAFAGGNIGNVHQPFLVGSGRTEILSQPIRCRCATGIAGWSPESGVDHVFSSPCGSLNVQSGICLRLHRLGVIQREHADSHRSGGFCHGLLECEPPTPHLLAVVGSVRASANRKTHSSPPPAPRTSAAPDISGDELL